MLSPFNWDDWFLPMAGIPFWTKQNDNGFALFILPIYLVIMKQGGADSADRARTMKTWLNALWIDWEDQWRLARIKEDHWCLNQRKSSSMMEGGRGSWITMNHHEPPWITTLYQHQLHWIIPNRSEPPWIYGESPWIFAEVVIVSGY